MRICWTNWTVVMHLLIGLSYFAFSVNSKDAVTKKLPESLTEKMFPSSVTSTTEFMRTKHDSSLNSNRFKNTEDGLINQTSITTQSPSFKFSGSVINQVLEGQIASNVSNSSPLINLQDGLFISTTITTQDLRGITPSTNAFNSNNSSVLAAEPTTTKLSFPSITKEGFSGSTTKKDPGKEFYPKHANPKDSSSKISEILKIPHKDLLTQLTTKPEMKFVDDQIKPTKAIITGKPQIANSDIILPEESLEPNPEMKMDKDATTVITTELAPTPNGPTPYYITKPVIYKLPLTASTEYNRPNKLFNDYKTQKLPFQTTTTSADSIQKSSEEKLSRNTTKSFIDMDGKGLPHNKQEYTKPIDDNKNEHVQLITSTLKDYVDKQNLPLDANVSNLVLPKIPNEVPIINDIPTTVSLSTSYEKEKVYDKKSPKLVITPPIKSKDTEFKDTPLVLPSSSGKLTDNVEKLLPSVPHVKPGKFLDEKVDHLLGHTVTKSNNDNNEYTSEPNGKETVTHSSQEFKVTTLSTDKTTKKKMKYKTLSSEYTSTKNPLLKTEGKVEYTDKKQHPKYLATPTSKPIPLDRIWINKFSRATNEPHTPSFNTQTTKVPSSAIISSNDDKSASVHTISSISNERIPDPYPTMKPLYQPSDKYESMKDYKPTSIEKHSDFIDEKTHIKFFDNIIDHHQNSFSKYTTSKYSISTPAHTSSRFNTVTMLTDKTSSRSSSTGFSNSLFSTGTPSTSKLTSTIKGTGTYMTIPSTYKSSSKTTSSRSSSMENSLFSTRPTSALGLASIGSKLMSPPSPPVTALPTYTGSASTDLHSTHTTAQLTTETLARQTTYKTVDQPSTRFTIIITHSMMPSKANENEPDVLLTKFSPTKEPPDEYLRIHPQQPAAVKPSVETNVPMIVGISFACPAFLAIGVYLIFITYKLRLGKKTQVIDVPPSLEAIQLQNRFTFDTPLDITQSVDFTSNRLDLHGISRMLENPSGIEDEFLMIPSFLPDLFEMPEGSESKNRYSNVIPIQETRVKLRTKIDADACPDYINANHVKGYSDKGYIATQGPLDSTREDFWRMVWEQQSQVIIMVTGLREHGYNKCSEYWPNSELGNVVRIYGDFEVALKERQVHQRWTTSILMLKHMEYNLCRNVSHFWLTSWPEYGVPHREEDIISFLIMTRPYIESSLGPAIVHCSPGTGRTGTIVTIDSAMKEFMETGTVDIPKTIFNMRQQRANSVQSKEQYILIYQVLFQYASHFSNTSLDCVKDF